MPDVPRFHPIVAATCADVSMRLITGGAFFLYSTDQKRTVRSLRRFGIPVHRYWRPLADLC